MSIIPIKQYSINGGLDMKFEEEFPTGLKGLVKEDQYEMMIRDCNRRLQKNRCKKKDIACLVAAPACLLTLVPFMVRYKKHQKRSKVIMMDVAQLWNEQHPLVRLKYDRHAAGLAFHLRTEIDEEEEKSPALKVMAKEQEILAKQKAKKEAAPAPQTGSDEDDAPAKKGTSVDAEDPWQSLANK